MPRTIGEILDRAVTTYVAAFVPLFLIIALAVIPTVVLEFAVLPGWMRTLGAMSAVLPGTAGPAQNARILAALGTPSTIGGFALIGLAALVLYTLAHTTMLIFAAAKLDGVPRSISAAYRAAVPRWIGQIAVSVAFVMFALAAYLGFALSVFVVTLIVFGAYALSHAAGIAVGVVLGVVAVAGLIGAFSLLYISWQISAVVIATEDAHPVRAIGRGFRRALERSLLRRSLLVAVAVLAIDLIGSLVFLAFGALVASLVHVAFVAAAIGSIGGIILWGLRSVFVLVYTRDVRVRREGADLLALTDEAHAPA